MTRTLVATPDPHSLGGRLEMLSDATKVLGEMDAAFASPDRATGGLVMPDLWEGDQA